MSVAPSFLISIFFYKKTNNFVGLIECMEKKKKKIIHIYLYVAFILVFSYYAYEFAWGEEGVS